MHEKTLIILKPDCIQRRLVGRQSAHIYLEEVEQIIPTSLPQILQHPLFDTRFSPEIDGRTVGALPLVCRQPAISGGHGVGLLGFRGTFL